MTRILAVPVLAALVLVTAGCFGKPKGGQEPFAEQVTDFHKLFALHCAGCHGADGMRGPGPRLHDPLYLAVANRDNIYNAIKDGRPGTPMPAFGKNEGGALTEEQIGAIVDGMEREWGQPAKFKAETLPVYDVAKAPPGDAARGQIAYQRNCMMCHGFGKFKGAAGAIADPQYLALVSDQNLRATMIVGRLDWGMPDWSHRIPRHPMTDQEMSDVTAWLSSLRPKYATLITQSKLSAPNASEPPPTSSSRGQDQSKQGR
jgi:cytochrome c oxidase cbb3-type subunit 3